MAAAIREATDEWWPMDPDSNPMKDMDHVRVRQIKGGMAGLEQKPGDLFASIIGKLQDWFGSLTQPQNGAGGLALKVGTDPVYKGQFLKIISGDPSLPTYFNLREEYPECQPVILNQGNCGACWAFSGAGMLGDRICMRTKGEIQVDLSPQNVVNCALENYGCDGGYMIPMMEYLVSEGVPSYQCQPYAGECGTCQR